MLDRRTRRSRRPRSWLVLLSFVALAIAAPVVVLAGGVTVSPPDGIALGAERPGESCPDQTLQPGASVLICADVTGPDVGGAGGVDLGILMPMAGIVVAAGIVALGVAFLVLRRRASVPFAPVDPGEWWTCRNCGKENVVGSPRCYACSTWRA